MAEKCTLPAERAAELISRKEFEGRSREAERLLRSIFTQYLIVDYSDGTKWKYVRCTSCEEGNLIEKSRLNKKKHNDFLECPFCGEKVQLKHRSKLRSGASLYETTSVTFVNVSKDGEVFLESGIGFWDYDGDMYMNESFMAKRRYYFSTEGVMAWKRSISVCPTFWYTGPNPKAWEPMKNVREPFQINYMYGFDGYGYLIGQQKIRDSVLKYSAIEQYFEEYHNVDLTEDLPLVKLFPQYLAAAATSPQVEMAVKLGMADMVGARIRDGNKNSDLLNWNAKDPASFLRMSKQEAKAVLKNGSLTMAELRAYHMIRQNEQNQKPEAIMEAIQLLTPANVTGRLAEECNAVGLPIMTVAKYIRTDKKRLGLWVDYITMARQLGYDLTNKTVLLPADLQERHDAAAELLHTQEDQLLLEAYQTIKADLIKKYSFKYNGLQVVIPETQDDIVREGKTLGHCVGGYAARHIKGTATILFIRRERKPGTPFLTVELDSKGNMRQIHGYKNERYPHAVSPKEKYSDFIETWKYWYQHGSRRDRSGRPIIKEKRQTA